MDITKKIENGQVIYSLSGRLDTQSAPNFQETLDSGFKNNEFNLIFDFKNIEYISSAGLRTVLQAQKKVNSVENGSLTLINVTNETYDIFELTGFTDFLNINPEE